MPCITGLSAEVGNAGYLRNLVTGDQIPPPKSDAGNDTRMESYGYDDDEYSVVKLESYVVLTLNDLTVIFKRKVEAQLSSDVAHL